MNKVIIPSAKVVTKDLQNVGKLPAIIYPIDQKCMMDLFVDLYSGTADSYEIVSYEAYEEVVKRTRHYNDVTICKLDKLRDLGYSIYYGLKNAAIDESDKIIINFADVIVFKEIPAQWGNACFYAEETLSSKWAFFEEEGGIITRVFSYSEEVDDLDTDKMLIGIFYIEWPLELLRILERWIKQPNEFDSIWDALMEYSKLHPFEMVDASEWFDIGHLDKYYNTQLEVKSRTFNYITIDRNRGILTKKSDNIEKFVGEVKWYLKLPLNLEYVSPRIYSYSLEYSKSYVSMEYYTYHTLHELFLYGDLKSEQWKSILSRIKFVINDFKKYSVCGESIVDSLHDMYVNKTIVRLDMLRNKPVFCDCFEQDIHINGKRYESLNSIINQLPVLADKLLFEVDSFHIIHGDLCFANILVDPTFSFIKLIDPRGEFGVYDIYGDTRYDIAKLMHSIEGKYDFIVKDLFDISYVNNEIKYSFFDTDKVDLVKKCFMDVFKEELSVGLNSLTLIESLLFLSMIPLHTESERQQMMMLAMGVELFDKVAYMEEHNGDVC